MIRLLVAAFMMLSACCPAWSADVKVAVAANFHGTLQRLAPIFQQESGHTLTLSSGSSGALTTQIANGAPFDVFLSADADRPERLEKAGLGLAGTRFVYAYGVPVLWSPRAGVVDAEGKVLLGGNFRYIAIADPKLAPYGAAAEEVMRGLGVFEALDGAGRIVRGQSIGQTHSQVASAAADLGFVALAQVRGPDGVAGSYWIPPKQAYAPIAQAAVVLTRTEVPDAARAFLAWLRGPSARAVIEQAGYGID